MNVRVDVGACTALAVCGCGWRGLALTHDEALVMACGHERAVHPEDRHARAALAMLRKRASRTVCGVAPTAAKSLRDITWVKMSV